MGSYGITAHNTAPSHLVHFTPTPSHLFHLVPQHVHPRLVCSRMGLDPSEANGFDDSHYLHTFNGQCRNMPHEYILFCTCISCDNHVTTFGVMWLDINAMWLPFDVMWLPFDAMWPHIDVMWLPFDVRIVMWSMMPCDNSYTALYVRIFDCTPNTILQTAHHTPQPTYLLVLPFRRYEAPLWCGFVGEWVCHCLVSEVVHIGLYRAKGIAAKWKLKVNWNGNGTAAQWSKTII